MASVHEEARDPPVGQIAEAVIDERRVRPTVTDQRLLLAASRRLVL
jgi:hypothetical protein